MSVNVSVTSSKTCGCDATGRDEVLGRARQKTVGVHATVDEDNVVVLGQKGFRSKGVFVVWLDPQGGTRTTKKVKFDQPNTNSF